MMLHSLGFFGSLFHSKIIPCFLCYVKPCEQITDDYFFMSGWLVPRFADLFQLFQFSKLCYGTDSTGKVDTMIVQGAGGGAR